MITSKYPSVALPAAILALSLTECSLFAQITSHIDRATFDAATAGSIDLLEDFEGFVQDLDFKLAPAKANGFSISAETSGNTFRNFIDVVPFQFAFTDNNGTNHASCFVDGNPALPVSITLSMDAPVDAFGIGFHGAGGAEFVRLIYREVNGTEITFEPDFTENPGEEFFGVTTLGAPIASLRIEARMEIGTGGEGFGIDDISGATAGSAPLVIDFETSDDFATPLVNGQAIEPGGEFGSLINVAGTSASGLTAAIFDSTIGGANAASGDQDLLVGRGNVLILQEDPQLNGGVYTSPDDDRFGGSLRIDFLNLPATPVSVDLIDICVLPGQGANVVLSDSAGATRTYTVPGGFTEDITVDGGTGLRTLDLTTLDPQVGFLAAATASEMPGFNGASVVAMEVSLDGSGAIDNLTFFPGSALTAPETEAYVLIGPALGTLHWQGEGADAVWSTDLSEVSQVVPFELGSAPTIPFPKALTSSGSLNVGVPALFAQVVVLDRSQGTTVLKSSPALPIGPLQLQTGGALASDPLHELALEVFKTKARRSTNLGPNTPRPSSTLTFRYSPAR